MSTKIIDRLETNHRYGTAFICSRCRQGNAKEIHITNTASYTFLSICAAGYPIRYRQMNKKWDCIGYVCSDECLMKHLSHKI